jgi:hypothetical protein
MLQATAYGLPFVATKNGGPVDILKVMNYHIPISNLLELHTLCFLFKNLLPKTLQYSTQKLETIYSFHPIFLMPFIKSYFLRRPHLLLN